MPASLIPLVTNSGRLFSQNKVVPESDGLVGIVDINDRNKAHQPTESVFNATGDSLLVADSRNQVTLLQIAQNRFNVVCASLREAPLSVTFTGKQKPQDQVLVVLKEKKRLQVHALNGKLLESIQANLHHQLEVKSAAVCPWKGLLLTLSPDACVLWSTNTSATVRKERSLFAQAGCHFRDAKFSQDGLKVGTLLRDGSFVLWELDGISGLPNRPNDGQDLKFRFPTPSVEIFDLGRENIVAAGGTSLPYLFVARQNVLGGATQQSAYVQAYKLPNGARGVEQVRFLTDGLLVGYLSEGIFYLVDLGQDQKDGQNKLQIALQIRLPRGAVIKRFDIDHCMNALALTASTVNVFLYNLPQAITNEQSLAKKRLQTGIEKDLVYTYLTHVDLNTDQFGARTTMSRDDQSSDLNQSQGTVETGFQNPFKTQAGGIGSVGQGPMDALFSQREGPRQLQSPLLNTNEKAQQYFSATASVEQRMSAQQLDSNSNERTLFGRPADNGNQLQLLVGASEETPSHQMSGLKATGQQAFYNGAQTTHQVGQPPMPMSVKSHDTLSDFNQRHAMAPQADLAYAHAAPSLGFGPDQQTIAFQQVGAAPQQHFRSQNQAQMSMAPANHLHNISQSTVAGPYQHMQAAQQFAPPTPQLQTHASQLLSLPETNNQPGVQHAISDQRSFLNPGSTALLSTGRQSAQLSSTDIASTSSQAPKKYDHSLDTNFAPERDSALDSSAAMASFNVPKLRRLLKQFGQFPDKYRTLTWKYLLKLPCNREAFQGLVGRGVHPAFKDLHKRYPVASHRLYNKLVRTLSALAFWSPVFADVAFLPAIVFPFVKVIPSDDLVVFEIIVSLVVHWLQVWFEAHPAEPLSVCLAIEQLVSSEDPSFTQSLRDKSFGPQQYGWPILSHLFTGVLSKEDWLRLVDHLFMRSDEPELLLYFCAAYILSSKAQLRQITCIEDLSLFTKSQTTVPFKKILTLTEQLHSKYKTVVFPGNVGHNLPIVTEQGAGYKLFTRYPDHFVNFQNRVREKIVNQEEEIQKKNDILVDLKTKAGEILEQEQRMRLQQEAMAQAEAERKNQVRTEMETLLQERIRLDELQRKARLEHVQALESAIKTSLTHQERLRDEEHRQMQDEVATITRQQKYEFESRLQDEMIANLEFKANQKLLEQLQKQQQDEHSKQTRERLELLHNEVLDRQKDSLRRWEEQRDETRQQNLLLTHQLKVQSEQLASQQEQKLIEDKFAAIRQEYDQMDRKLQEEKEAREQERLQTEQAIREHQSANENLIQEQKRQAEQRAQIERERAHLEHLKQLEEQDRHRVAKVASERQIEVLKSREFRENNLNEDAALQADRKAIQEEKDRIERAREQLGAQEQTEIERRDFMKMIRTTAENVRGIVLDGQKQMEQQREQRNELVPQDSPSAAATNGQAWVMTHPKYNQNDTNDLSKVEDVISERERRVRELNESMREQLSLQYSQQMLAEQQQENSNRLANPQHHMDGQARTQQLSATVTDRQRPVGQGQNYADQQKGLIAYMTPSSTEDSHFSEESSDVESYHHSQLKQTHMPVSTHPPLTTSNLVHTYQGQPAQPMIHTHLDPVTKVAQHLGGAMPGSKSSLGVDISSSFVSSATESVVDYANGAKGKGVNQSDYSDTTSMCTSQDTSYIAAGQQQQYYAASQSHLVRQHQALPLQGEINMVGQQSMTPGALGLCESQSSAPTSSLHASAFAAHQKSGALQM